MAKGGGGYNVNNDVVHYCSDVLLLPLLKTNANNVFTFVFWMNSILFWIVNGVLYERATMLSLLDRFIWRALSTHDSNCQNLKHSLFRKFTRMNLIDRSRQVEAHYQWAKVRMPRAINPSFSVYLGSPPRELRRWKGFSSRIRQQHLVQLWPDRSVFDLAPTPPPVWLVSSAAVCYVWAAAIRYIGIILTLMTPMRVEMAGEHDATL